MEPATSLTFALIGSGRVASHLAPALVSNGATCVGVWSRTLANAEVLANRLGSEVCKSIEELTTTPADMVIISVSDDAIGAVTAHIPSDSASLIVHTSGSTPMEVLSAFRHHGVLYPMQTFSKEREIEMQSVPLFLEANGEKELELLERVARNHVGANKITHLSSNDRALLHLASVFACNFVNHMYASAEAVMQLANLDFSLLQPLMEETFQKALRHSPSAVQTGPAVRGDQKTIARHLALLAEHPDLSKLYKSVSDAITQKYLGTQ